jgi:exodeoxyribonuclease VIII
MPTLTTALTNDEYRSVKAWSKSDLDNVRKSTALIEWNKNSPTEGSDSVDLGTHIHCALLEPDVFEKDYIKTPDFDTRTKSGREAIASFKSNMGDKIVLDHLTYQTVIAMRESVLAHPVARSLLTKSGVSEASIFYESHGMKKKARPDRIVDPEHYGYMLVDVKKTADMDKFKWSVRDFRYHVQAAYYTDAYKHWLEENDPKYNGQPIRFVFVVVGEKRSIGRNPVRVFELGEETVEMGRMDYLEDLESAREYEEFGCGLEIEQLDMSKIIR